MVYQTVSDDNDRKREQEIERYMQFDKRALAEMLVSAYEFINRAQHGTEDVRVIPKQPEPVRFRPPSSPTLWPTKYIATSLSSTGGSISQSVPPGTYTLNS